MVLSGRMEGFALIRRRLEPDGLGGFRAVTVEEAPFRGRLSAEQGAERNECGRLTMAVMLFLLHDAGRCLKAGEYVRRLRDGVCYRVLSGSGDMEAPPWTQPRFRQCRVERVEEGEL